MESLRAVLLGGIAFETPPDSKQPVAANNQSFPLYRNFEDAQSAGFGRQIRLMSYFPGSVAGLEPGADVTLHGLKIGEVTDVDLIFDPKLDRIVVPVHYRIEAGRIAQHRGRPSARIRKRSPRTWSSAASAPPCSRRASSPAQKDVALERVPDAPPATLEKKGDVFIVPSSEGGGFDAITRSASRAPDQDQPHRVRQDRQQHRERRGKGLDTTINGPQIKSHAGGARDGDGRLQDIAASSTPEPRRR